MELEDNVISRTYLRYEEERRFGVVASAQCTSLKLETINHKYLFAGSVQDILVYDVESSTLVATLCLPFDVHSAGNDYTELLCFDCDDESNRSATKIRIVAGYNSGTVYLFEVDLLELETLSRGEGESNTKKQSLATFYGHGKGVNCIKFNQSGSLCASGSKDTSIIVWDIVSQQGLFKLKAHSDQITQLAFLELSGVQMIGGAEKTQEILVSSSKDATIKCWDLHSQYCLKTIVGHRASVLSIAGFQSCSRPRILSAAKDSLLKAIEPVTPSHPEEVDESTPAVSSDPVTTAKDASFKFLDGEINRKSSERVGNLLVAQNGLFVAVQTRGKVVELYRVRSKGEVGKKRKRRLKRMEDHQKQSKAEEVIEAKSSEEANVKDELEFFCLIRTKHDIRSVSFGKFKWKQDRFEVVLSLRNNLLVFYEVLIEVRPGDLAQKKRKQATSDSEPTKQQSKTGKRAIKFLEVRKKREIGVQGHRSDIRCCSFSTEAGNPILLTLDTEGEMRLWNIFTGQAIRRATMVGNKTDRYCLSCAFVPGGDSFLVGSKSGKISLFNLNTFELITAVQAHGSPSSNAMAVEDDENDEQKSTKIKNGAIWSLDVNRNMKGFVSAGADCYAKFWEFDLAEDGVSPDIVHTRTLKMSDEIVCAQFSNTLSSERQLVCLALLDNTVKVFDQDSLKFRLSLYGHKLPVMAMDISDDDTILVTGSADKNIKIWGLDFGDCHRSLFAHDLPILGVQFIPNTHHFFTSSRDGTIKYWDADSFAQVCTVIAHTSEIWCLAMNKDKFGSRGTYPGFNDESFLVSIGHDKLIKLFRRTKDIVFPQEERQKLLNISEGNVSRLSNLSLSNIGGATNDQLVAYSHSNMKTNVLDDTWNTDNIPGLQVLGEKRQEMISSLPISSSKLHTEVVLSASEKVLQAIDFFSDKPGEQGQDMAILKVYQLNKHQYLVKSLLAIRRAQLDFNLMMLPFNYVVKLFTILSTIVENSQAYNVALELQAEILLQICVKLLRFNFKQVVANQDEKLMACLRKIRTCLRQRMDRLRNTIGTNIAGLKYIKHNIASSKAAIE